MIKTTIFFSFSLLFFLLSSVFASPKINIKEKEFDFGSITQGDVVTHDFNFENIGDAALIIGKVIPSCGCTIGKLNKDTIQPGNKGKIEVTFNSDRFTGKQHKSLTITSNDPANPSEKISFTAFVKTAFEINPGYITFNSSKDSLTTLEKEITVRIINRHSAILSFVDMKPLTTELYFNKTFPFSARIKTGDSIDIIVKPVIKGTIKNTIYGFLDVKLEFSDGRKLEKRIGTAIKKWRNEK